MLTVYMFELQESVDPVDELSWKLDEFWFGIVDLQ